MSAQQAEMNQELEHMYYVIMSKAVDAAMVMKDGFTKDELSLMARSFGIQLPREIA